MGSLAEYDIYIGYLINTAFFWDSLVSERIYVYVTLYSCEHILKLIEHNF